jgi:putative SOS response-associated peptidase YedK
MCGRFVQLAALFARLSPWPELADDLAATADRYNLAPTQRAAIIMEADGRKSVRRLRWGLIAPWMRDLKGGFSTINARVETVATKPAFRAAFKAPRRCLIPMAGYYEWVQEGTVKQPYFIARADGEPLYAAGLWEPPHALQDDDAEGSCTIITQDAIDLAGQVHDRMPVFLSPDVADAWMTAAPDEATAILAAAEVPALAITRVSRAINNSRNPGGPEALLPIDA